MKIFLVIPSLMQGGAERVMSELANEFCDFGHKVTLVLLTDVEDFYKVNIDVTIYRLGFKNTGFYGRIFSELTVFLKLRKLFKGENPDIVLSFMDKYNVLTILCSLFLNLKVFVSDRSNPNKPIPNKILILKKLFYRYATGIVAQTSLAKSILEDVTGHSNIRIIPNPIKKVTLYPQIEREKIILSIGRLVPEKGQKYLIESFAELKLDGWKLVILGEGRLREELESQIQRLNLKTKVLLPGSVSDVDSWYARASIFAFPSISEGFPNSLVEAMSAGLPCISFDCDAGPSDIIHHGVNGYLVGFKQVHEFSEVLRILIENDQLRAKIGMNAMKVNESLDGTKISREFLNFFSESV